MFVLVQQSRLRELLFATSVFALSLPLVKRNTTAASVRILTPGKITLAFILERKTVTDWIAGRHLDAQWYAVIFFDQDGNFRHHGPSQIQVLIRLRRTHECGCPLPDRTYLNVAL